jgi:hypothetical protein
MYTLYIVWLCSAVFYHLPSFEALGVDIKADISLALSVACYSLFVSGHDQVEAVGYVILLQKEQGNCKVFMRPHRFSIRPCKLVSAYQAQ